VSSDRRFQSFLGPEIERFLAHKRSLRWCYIAEEKTLALLDAYLSKKKIGSLAEVTPALVDEFLLSRPRSRPRQPAKAITRRPGRPATPGTRIAERHLVQQFGGGNCSRPLFRRSWIGQGIDPMALQRHGPYRNQADMGSG
jgi:hypothetical protein